MKFAVGDDEPLACPSCVQPRPAAGWPEDQYVGRQINGKFHLVERIGGGGYGVVVRGRQMDGDTCLGDVVLKFLHPQFAQDPAARQRFVNEVRIARALDSPHVVKIFDFGFDGQDRPYIVMEHLTGIPLTKLMNSPLSPTRLARIGIQLASTLDVCHRRGVLHLDLKPDNIFLLSDGDRDFVKIIDFGISRMVDATASQTIRGTPHYMAPEQALGQPVDDGADIYALGVILYQCLAGRHPIDVSSESSGPLGLLQQMVDTAPVTLRRVAPHLPESLGVLLDKMMAKDRVRRPVSMHDVQVRLKAIGAQQGWLPEYADQQPNMPTRTQTAAAPAIQRRGRPWAWLTALLLIVTSLSVAGVLYLRNPQSPVAPGGSPVRLTDALVQDATAAQDSIMTSPTATREDKQSFADGGVNPRTDLALPTQVKDPRLHQTRRRQRQKRGQRPEPKPEPMRYPAEKGGL